MATVTRVVTQSRRYDAVYDPVFTSSEVRSHLYRAAVGPMDDASNRTFEDAVRATVLGRHRFRYFKRPVVPMLQAIPAEILVQALPERAPHSTQILHTQDVVVSRTRTVAVQTLYRESEAQTDPYTSDYIIRSGAVPEVLTLTHLTYGHGLPASLAEVEMIERAREKRLFESSLPPATDEASFKLRRRLMEEQEFNEWATRENEIKRLQDERLELLRHALLERDQQNEGKYAARIEQLRQRKIEEKDRALAKIQRKRIKVLRKMFKSRKDVQKKKEKRDIVADYTNFGSKVYAPVAREGISLDKAANKFEVQPLDLNTFEGVTDLEKTVPRRMMDSSTAAIKPVHQTVSRTFARKEAVLAAHLNRAEDQIRATKKSLAEHQEEGARKFNLRNIQERPPTPTVSEISVEDEQRETAILLLQRLIRGRAVQNIMFDGKEKRLDLINELRATEDWDQASLAEEERRLVQLHKDRVLDGVAEALQGEVVSRTLDSLSKELLRFREQRRIAAMVKLAERDRRMREAEESGRRQAEEQLRAREDELFRQVMGVHHGTVDSYLQSIITESVSKASAKQAMEEAKLKAERINKIVDALEEQYNSPETIVKELVNSFLLPEVQREKVQRNVQLQERRFIEAAHRTIRKTMDATETKVAMAWKQDLEEVHLETSS
eukprot:GILK01003764.1.p1 GENE.GILK01003764.1~~GILK01003764.1.p1  ORF type:complete len:665 (+),score=144.46 GILK01003764.1:160-2154(+)